MKNTHQNLFFLLLLLCHSTGMQAQLIQKGADINGEAAFDLSGYSVIMPDANTVAIGAIDNDGLSGNSFSTGHVRVYSWDGSNWVQKGNDINGEAATDQSGFSVSMPNANTIAIGAILNDGINGNNSGHVRVFIWNSSVNDWIPKGNAIDGETDGIQSGFSVSMPDANTLAIGAPFNNGVNGNGSGHVRVYSWNSVSFTWVQKGADIDGEAAGDQSGTSVSMPDANTVAIGSPENGGFLFSGHTRVFSWNGSAWVQKGSDIVGEGLGGKSGFSVSMPDADTVAISDPFNNGNGANAGHVRIYSWNGSVWVQKGTDIDGEAAGDQSGFSISMPNADTIAIGAPQNEENGLASGHVRLYRWNGTAWIKSDADIDSENTGDRFGFSVSMPDANTIAIGAINNDGNGNNSGHARVFAAPTLSLNDFTFDKDFSLFPNPVQNRLNIAVNNGLIIEGFEIYNINGQIIRSGNSLPTNGIELSNLASGMYLIKLKTDKGIKNAKFIKQ